MVINVPASSAMPHNALSLDLVDTDATFIMTTVYVLFNSLAQGCSF